MFSRWLAFASFSLISTVALAAPVTLNVVGQITQLNNPNGMLDLALTSDAALGTPVSVSLTYDLDLFSADQSGYSGAGLYKGGITSARIQIGNDVFTPADPGSFMIFLSPGSTVASYSLVVAGDDVAGPAGQPFKVLFSIGGRIDLGSQVSKALPSDPLFYTSLQSLRFSYAIGDAATWNSPTPRDAMFAEVTPVPLPAGVWLLLGGLGALGAFGMKRRAAA